MRYGPSFRKPREEDGRWSRVLRRGLGERSRLALFMRVVHTKHMGLRIVSRDARGAAGQDLAVIYARVSSKEQEKEGFSICRFS
jgi:hypothetical protein